MTLDHILKKPIISEKSSQMISDNQYVFSVAPRANKNQIKNTIQEVFKVTVISVNTIKVPGKKRRLGKKRLIFQSRPWKKAIVKLKPGDKIKLFDTKK